MLREFHTALNIHGGLAPDAPTADVPGWVRRLRIDLLDEEVDELRVAMEQGNLVKIADGIADVAFVVIGTAVPYGIPFDDVFAAVHRSNMTKVNSPELGKLVKGPGYEPPRIAEILQAAATGTPADGLPTMSAVDVPALVRNHARLAAELREQTRIHELLLQEILRNAGPDITGADEPAEYLAEFYVRQLEQETAGTQARAMKPAAGDAASSPPVVCLCGSTRFYDEFRAANLRLTLAGEIVLSIGCDTKSDADLAAAAVFGDDPATVKARLDDLHRRKIDIADYILVLNVDGYVGESTRAEIDYAVAHGKPVRYLEAVQQATEGHRAR